MLRQMLSGFVALMMLACVAPCWAQTVRVERIVVHGKALEGNLEGNAVDREVLVYLPPDYDRSAHQRYPVIYALHGYSIDNATWAGEIRAPQTFEAAYQAGARGMIIVLPNVQTRHNGSMYSSSVTTGDWEGFIADDLVQYIDLHYRTLPNRESRGLAGHSMGGYGTVRIGMKRPDVFSVLYAMSPCCLSARSAPAPEEGLALEKVTSVEQAQGLGFLGRATFAVSSAWSPNPKKPPFYLDLPTRDGQVQADVIARWAANAPISMIHQYVPNMRRYTAIALDVGDRDGLKVDTIALHQILSDYGIETRFEIYPGDHVSGVADRFQHNVLPFFSETLAFGPPHSR